MDLEGQLSNPDKPLRTLVPPGLSATSPARHALRTTQKPPRTRRAPRPPETLGHYSNPEPAPIIEQPSRPETGTPLLTGWHRTQRRLRPADVDALVDGYHAGATIMQLAERFDISRTTVMAHLDRRHVQRRRVAKQWDDGALATVADAYAEGYSLAAIANQHDLDPQTVGNRLRRAGIKIRPRRGWA